MFPGDFDFAGGQTARSVARWDGAAWAPLGPGLTGALRTVHALLILPNGHLVAAGCGTPWQLDTRGAVLFIEDVGEAIHRVDRMLLQLRHAGLLDAAAGFLLGSFTEDEDPQAVVQAELMRYGKPVLGGWPAGHGVPNRPLPMGALVRLDAGAGTLVVEQDVLVP